MSDPYDTMAGIDPTTNARFTLLGNGQYSEMISDQVQLFWDPVTGDGRCIFNALPYLNIGGTYTQLGGVMNNLMVDFIDKIGTCYGEGLTDPVTGADLGGISVAGISLIVKAAFDKEYNAAAAAQAAAVAAAEAAAEAAAAASSGDTGSGADSSGSTGS
jgi:hypothetical protein